MIKVSVIIPVYNAGNYLRQCLDSVLGQSLKELEVICVDDGSTDSSREIIMEYANRDERVKSLSQSNSGPGAARNLGLSVANGENVIFLDADDWFEGDFLEKTCACIERTEADICICKAERFDSQTGKTLPSEWMLKTEYIPGEAFAPSDICEYLFQFTYGQVWDKLYRKSFLEDTGLKFPEFRNSEDTAFAFMSLLSSERIAVIPEVFVHYRVNNNGSVSNSIIKQPEAPYEAFRLVMEHLEAKTDKDIYWNSFLNWAMEYLVWHVTNMPDKDIRKQYFEEVRTVWLPKFDFNEIMLNGDSKVNFCKFMMVKLLPYRLMSSLLDSYKLCQKGKSALHFKNDWGKSLC